MQGLIENKTSQATRWLISLCNNYFPFELFRCAEKEVGGGTPGGYRNQWGWAGNYVDWWPDWRGLMDWRSGRRLNLCAQPRVPPGLPLDGSGGVGKSEVVILITLNMETNELFIMTRLKIKIFLTSFVYHAHLNFSYLQWCFFHYTISYQLYFNILICNSWKTSIYFVNLFYNMNILTLIS